MQSLCLEGTLLEYPLSNPITKCKVLPPSESGKITHVAVISKTFSINICVCVKVFTLTAVQ